MSKKALVDWGLRAAGRKKKGQGGPEPGRVSDTVRRRMGDTLADLFDEFGPEIYSNASLALKEAILEAFQEGFEGLEQTIKNELGRRGVEESQQHIRAWSAEIVEDINHFGLDEAATALEDFVSSLTAEYMPIGIDNTQTNKKANPVSRSVYPRRSHMRVPTGRPQIKDCPKSPRRRMPEIHFQYCTMMG